MGAGDPVSMFLLGLVGTGHCIGMCGPLVLAIPAREGRLVPHLLYHLGRLSTYAGIGALVGGAGAALSRVAASAGGDPLRLVARVQVGFSLLAGAFLLAFGLMRLGILREPAWMAAAVPTRIPGFGRVRRDVMARGGGLPVFVFGLMMGLLPCGLSYAAFALALTSGGGASGAVLLLCFGFGTVPGLLVVGTGASGLLRRYRGYSDLLSGVLLIGMSVSIGVDALQALLTS